MLVIKIGGSLFEREGAISAIAEELSTLKEQFVLVHGGASCASAFAEKLGITTFDKKQDYGLALVLGSAEVPLIEMTNAYAVFANKGILNEYIFYTEILDKNGKTEHENRTKQKNAMSDAVAYIISSILSDNDARKDVFGSSLNLTREAAVKTGTTNDYKDALTIGYTPQIAVGAWVGNNDTSPMDSVAGSSGAAPIWRQIMEAYFKGKPIVKFLRPAGVLRMPVCRENGLKAEVATPSAYPEFFLRGTLPTKSCTSITPTQMPEPTIFIEEPTPTELPTSSPEPTIDLSPTVPATSGGIINLSP